MKSLIEKELNSSDKILKPDFNLKSGRELLAFYLHSKFHQILTYDQKCSTPLFKDVNPNFVSRFSRRLIDNPSKRILIGITGESASGKSTICREIKKTIEQFNLPVSVLSTDNYFNDISKEIKEYGGFDNLRDAGYDLDAPSNFQLDILKEDLISLSQGIDIKAPMYLPNGTGISVPHSQDIFSNKFIVVEGIATMYETVQDVFDIKIYVETANDVRKERFVTRACKERNQDEENALKHWNYLIEAGDKYVKPFRNQADIVLDGNIELEYFASILEYIHAITNNFDKDSVNL
ncbi:AAA family ATPase [bacterium]|nr:AAA family ATPase [bacterium]MBR6302030.1 AAA family ATPase [bacterium]